MDLRTKNIYNLYTIQEKLFYLSLFHKGLSKHEIEKKYNVPTRTLRSWLEKEEGLKSVIGKIKKYKLFGGGKRLETKEIEPELIHWVLYLRDLGIVITTNEIIYKAIELMPSLKAKK